MGWGQKTKKLNLSFSLAWVPSKVLGERPQEVWICDLCPFFLKRPPN